MDQSLHFIYLPIHSFAFFISARYCRLQDPKEAKEKESKGCSLKSCCHFLCYLYFMPQQETFPVDWWWSLTFKSLSDCASSDIWFHFPLLFGVQAFSEWNQSHAILWFCHSMSAWLWCLCADLLTGLQSHQKVLERKKWYTVNPLGWILCSMKFSRWEFHVGK